MHRTKLRSELNYIPVKIILSVGFLNISAILSENLTGFTMPD